MQQFIASSGKCYDIIFMDVSMPIMDGFQTINEICKMSRQYPQINDTTIVINSAYDGSYQKRQECQLKNIRVCPKPLTYQKVSSIIEEKLVQMKQ